MKYEIIGAVILGGLIAYLVAYINFYRRSLKIEETYHKSLNRIVDQYNETIREAGSHLNRISEGVNLILRSEYEIHRIILSSPEFTDISSCDKNESSTSD